MKVIVFSHNEHLNNEHAFLAGMFEEGLTNFHLSKPGLNFNELRSFIQEIPAQYRKYVILHGYRNKELVKEFGLKGLHINSEERKEQYFTATRVGMLKISNPNIHLSTTYHHLKSLQKSPSYYNYVILDNIFKSRTKEVFKSHHDWTAIEKTLRGNSGKRVIAAGGVSEKKFPTLKNLGFSGALVRTGIWNDADPVEAYKRHKEAAKAAKSQSFYNYNY